MTGTPDRGERLPADDEPTMALGGLPAADEPTVVLGGLPAPGRRRAPDPAAGSAFDGPTMALPLVALPGSAESTIEESIAPDPATLTVPATPDRAGSGDRGGSPAGTGAGDEGGSVARNSATMAVGSMASRVTGLLRNTMIAAAIGSYLVGNAYVLANTLPNMVYELLLGGVLASVVIPLLVRARQNDPDRGEAYAQRLMTFGLLLLAGATILAVLCAPLLSSLFFLFPGDHPPPGAGPPGDFDPAYRHELVTTLSYLLLPEIFFYGAAALIAAVLNTRGHFAAPAWTPILNNVVVILTAGAFILLPSPNDPRFGPLSTAQILVLGVGTTLGIVLQAAGLLPAVRKVGFRWRWRGDFRKLHLRELARISAWMLVYVVVSQVGVLIVFAIANAAGGDHGPGPAVYNNAFLVFMMAHGIVAVSIMTALMPRMSAAAAAGRHRELADQISSGTRLVSVILIPATAAYLVLGRPLAVALLSYRSYSHEAAVDTGFVIAIAGLGLVPFAISQLQVFAFYAMPDTKTPALLNIPVVALRIAVDVLLFVVLPAVTVAAGLMAGNAISYVAGVALGYWLLRRRIGRLGLRQVGSTLARLTVATALAAIPAWLAVLLIRELLGDRLAGSLAQLVIGGLVLLAGYVAAATVLRVREVRELTGVVRARLGR